MSILNYMGRVALAAVVVAGLGACSKKKNGSVAATPASTCTANAYGQYVNSLGQQCSATGQTLCPATGVYQTYVNGQVVQQQCTPNQYINSYPYQGQYPWQYTTNPMQFSGCQKHTYDWGVPYVPVNLGGQYYCLRYDLMQQYTQNTYYGSYGYDYYYAYPPYQQGYGGYGGGYCPSIEVGGEWGYVNFCLGGLF